MAATRRDVGSPLGDVEVINALLCRGLRFGLEPAGAGGSELEGEGWARARGGRSSHVTGVLVLERGGERRSVGFPVVLRGSRRGRLLSLSACLAECAMELGLGAGVYRRPGG